MRKRTMMMVWGTALSASLLGGPADAGEERLVKVREQAGKASMSPEMAFPGRQGELRKVGYYVADRLVEILEVQIIDGQAVFQGDIVFPLAEDGNIRIGTFLDEIDAKSTGRTAANLLWPNRTIPFVLDASLTAVQQTRVNDALNHWRANTRLTFVARTNQTDFVTFFQQAGGCSSSAVGRAGGHQVVRLDPQCETGNIIHEIGHVVGLWHEHQRADRDNSLVINWANIASGFANNFQTYTALGQNGGDFGNLDFGSIMMYSSDAFSFNGQPTITRLNGTTFTGQRTALSQGDKNGVNCNMYPTTPTVSLSCTGNFRGSRQISCTANPAGGGIPFTFAWTYNGTAASWNPSGQNAFAYYNAPGCDSTGTLGVPFSFNRFTVTVTDACGQTANASISSLPCN